MSTDLDPRVYRLPERCGARDCTDEQPPVAIVIDGGRPTLGLCEAHLQAVLNPTVTFTEAGEVEVVAPDYPTQPDEGASDMPTRGCPQCGRTDWCEPGCSYNVDEMAR